MFKHSFRSYHTVEELLMGIKAYKFPKVIFHVKSGGTQASRLDGLSLRGRLILDRTA